MENTILCGASIRDITPTREMGVLPMPVGFSASQKVITDVHDPLNLRVITLKEDDRTFILVSMDIVNLNADIYGPALSERTGVPEEMLFFLESSAHSTIRAGVLTPESKDPEGIRKQKIYTDYVMKQLLDAADEALGSMKPARVGFGSAQSYVNMNRYLPARAEENGKAFFYADQGMLNPEGTSDHTVAVIRFEALDGRPIAFFINYPIFNVLMHNNAAGENGNGAISADLAGYVSTHVEKHFPGAVAMWSGGAGCDQNPIISAECICPDPDSKGDIKFNFNAEACTQILTLLGQVNYADTLRAIDGASKCTEKKGLYCSMGGTRIPGRSQKISSPENSEFDWAEFSDRDDKVLHLSVLRIGDIAIAFHGGAIFSSIGLHMKAESILENTIVSVGYVNSKVPFDKAVCDDETLALGGHDPAKSEFRPGFAKSALTLLMNRLIMETENEPYHAVTPVKRRDNLK